MVDQKVVNSCTLTSIDHDGKFCNAASVRCPYCREIRFKIAPEKKVLGLFKFFDSDNIVFWLSFLNFLINTAKHLIFAIAPKRYNLNKTEKENKELLKFQNILSNYNFDIEKAKNDYGTSIRGKVARELFRDCEKVSVNIGISKELLECLSQGFSLRKDKESH